MPPDTRPYVADYACYLPATSPVRATAVVWSYFGIALSGIWLFILGAYLTSITGFGFDTLGASSRHREQQPQPRVHLYLRDHRHLHPGVAGIAVDVRRRQHRHQHRHLTAAAAPSGPAGVRARVAALTPVAVICLIAAIMYARSFAATFTDVLSVLLILLIPWSAINLADFYFVRRGHYDVEEIFKPDGIYGSYNVAGLVSFALGFGAEWIFANLGFYQGPGGPRAGRRRHLLDRRHRGQRWLLPAHDTCDLRRSLRRVLGLPSRPKQR